MNQELSEYTIASTHASTCVYQRPARDTCVWGRRRVNPYLLAVSVLSVLFVIELVLVFCPTQCVLGTIDPLPDLSASAISVQFGADRVMTYTITVSNTGAISASVKLTDTLPAATEYISGTLRHSFPLSATVEITNHVLLARTGLTSTLTGGMLPPGQAFTITYQVMRAGLCAEVYNSIELADQNQAYSISPAYSIHLCYPMVLKNANLANPAPDPAFVGSPRIGAPPLMVIFADTTPGDETARLWNFGDGVTSTLSGPTHTYTATGAYTVTLTVTNTAGSAQRIEPGYIQVHSPSITCSTFTPAFDKPGLFIAALSQADALSHTNPFLVSQSPYRIVAVNAGMAGGQMLYSLQRTYGSFDTTGMGRVVSAEMAFTVTYGVTTPQVVDVHPGWWGSPVDGYTITSEQWQAFTSTPLYTVPITYAGLPVPVVIPIPTSAINPAGYTDLLLRAGEAENNPLWGGANYVSFEIDHPIQLRVCWED